MERIGMIGPGRMGLAMVRHLVAAGYSVTATDIDPDRRAKAADAGATSVGTVAEVAASSDYAIVAVGFDAETVAVTTGAGGLVGTMAPGSCIAICSTSAPETVRAIAEAAAANGIDVLDAPICRGRWSADDGTLLALVGGTDAVVERSRPVFACFCSDIAHLGPVGHGQFGKAMNNFLMWISGLGMIEAGRLAEAFGADLTKLRDGLLISSARSATMEDWEPDDLHLGAEGHADRLRSRRSARPVDAACRRGARDGQAGPPHQGHRSARLDRQGRGAQRSRAVGGRPMGQRT